MNQTTHVMYEQPRHASWGAIFGGLFLAAGTHLLLSMLGLAIGISAINPAGESNPAEGFMIGSMLWWTLSAVISLFIGGWAAGNLSGQPGRIPGTLHGLVVWSASVLLMILLTSSIIGSIVGGGFWALKNGLTAADYGATTTAQKLISQIDQKNAGLRTLEKELDQLLKQTDKKRLKPEKVDARIEEIQNTITKSAKKTAMRPSSIEQQIDSVITELRQQWQSVDGALDKSAVVNVITARTDLNEQEARQAADRWYAQWQTFKQETWPEIQETAQNVKQDTKQFAEQTSKAVSEALLWSTFMLLIGAFAAALGGGLGSPPYPQHENDVNR
ncbi:MAG: hypothetical protein ACLFPX_01065 [Candidatus Omnitrophota bacterium]